MNTIKTIIVDDENRIRRRLERLVQSCSEEFEVIAMYADGKEAFDEITSQSISFDLLITDVQMPEMDGLTLVSQLKETNSFMTIIVSGYDDFSYLQTAMREGAVNYILKPVEKTQFTEQMEEVKNKIYMKREEEKEWSDVKEKASQLTYTRQIQFLSEITWNDELDLSLLDWTKQFPKGLYELVYISVDQPVTEKSVGLSGNWDQKIEGLIQHNQMIEKNSQYWLWKGRKLQYWLMLFDSSSMEANFELKTDEVIRQWKDSIQRLTPFTVSIAYSNRFEDLALLPNIKDQLLTLLQYRIIHGGNKVYHTDLLTNMEEQQSKSVSSIIYKCVQQIISSLDNKSESETGKALQQFFHELETLQSPALIEDAVNYLCLQILNRWMEFDGFGETSDLLPGALQLTKRAANFNQLKDNIKIWVLQIKEKLLNRKQQDSDPIHRAKAWIHENLGDQITIKNIAEHVYMSPTYFSNFFKSQTGETILDYVTKCRLEKAKELLGTTDMKIYDISAELGYQDTKYFSRLFKQWYGKSPSQYREHHFNKN